MGMTFGEVLKQFKDGESAENIVPLVEEESLRGAVVAWKSTVITVKGGVGATDECGELSPAAQWEWLWSKVEFDMARFGVVAGCRGQDAANLHLRLRGLRLIYPDGTIHSLAAKYLQSLIMAKLKKAT
jgi:hypothetical protein